MLSCMSFIYILDNNSLSVLLFANIFSHSIGCLSVLSTVSFAMQKFLSLIRSHLFIFWPFPFVLGDKSKKVALIYVKECSTYVLLYGFNGFQSYIQIFLKRDFYLVGYARSSEKATATHSSTLAWKIPRMEEPGGLQSMGSLRVGHD